MTNSEAKATKKNAVAEQIIFTVPSDLVPDCVNAICNTKGGLSHLINELGWQGGTRQQVIDEILRRKELDYNVTEA